MFMKGSSSMLIAPCYDGRMLPGIQQVAGDGLSLISIKQSHRNCKFKCDPDSNQTFISCAEGIKARNSFRNLHKPDLRKVRGLECSTTESMVQLFKAHNVENAGKVTYKKRVLRLLTSLVSKKSKSHSKPEVLLQSGSWPVNMCVLSSVCQEQEMKQPSTLNLQNFSSVLDDVMDDEKALRRSMELKSFCVAEQTNTCNKNDILSPVETVFISIPDPLTNSSDNAFIDVDKKIDSSNGGDVSSQENFTYSQLKQDKQTCEAAAPNQTASSSFELKPKKSLHHISISSDQNYFTDAIRKIQIHPNHIVNEDVTDTTNNDKSAIVIDDHDTENEVEERIENLENDSSMNNYLTDDATVNQEFPENSSSEVVQSIFTDMFKEMQEIEDYISSYISSFCMREEEFENYPALKRTSSEVVSHFFEQVHSPTIFEIEKNENGSSNSCAVSNSECEQKPKKEETFSMDEKPRITENKGKEECNIFDEGEISEYIYGTKNISTLEWTKSYKTNNNSIDDPNNLVAGKNRIRENISGYCYWEESDLIDNELLLEPTCSTGSNYTVMENNKALIAMSFFDNVWKEFYQSADILSPSNDVREEHQSLHSDRYQWVKMYDEDILKEAENIADCIDNFIVSGCFPNNKRSANNNSCTITEIDDDFEQHFLKNDSNYYLHQFQDPGLVDKCQEAVRSTATQMFGFPKNLKEHASNESLYHENQLNDEEDAETNYQRRQSYYVQENSTEDLPLKLTDINDPEDQKLITYEIPTSAGTQQFHINESLDQLNESIRTMPGNIPSSPNNEQNLIRKELYSSSNELKVDKKSSRIIVNSKIRKDIDITCIDTKNEFSKKEQSKTSLDQTSKNSNSCEIKDSQNMGTPEYANDFSKNQNYLNDKELTQKEEKVRNIHEQSYFAEEILNGKTNEVLNNQVFSSCDSIKDKFEQDAREKKYSMPELNKEDSNTGRSRFEQTPEATVSEISQFVFTSPNVQLNLTNPLLDVNKK